MLSLRINRHIIQAQQGNQQTREWLIAKHKKYILQTCSSICNRYLSWENDEELSIGLLAFNEAIDAYDIKINTKFTTFAYLVIKKRLIDYFRSQDKYKSELLITSSDTDELEILNNKEAVANFAENNSLENLSLLIEYFKNKLETYAIDINELPEFCPKHSDSRETLQKVSHTLINNPNLLNHLLRYKQLPIKELNLATGQSRKVLERGRKYIIALTLIFIEPQLTPLRKFSKFNIGGSESFEK